MSPQNIFHLFCFIVPMTTSAFAQSRYSTAMQEAHAIPQEVKDFIDTNPQGKAFIETLKTSNIALQSRVDFLQAELEKISRLFAAYLRGPRKETHISGSEQTWLPFDSQKELDEARAQAEADAQKVIDDNEAKKAAPPKKKPKTQALPSHLPVVDRVYDVPESQRICLTHGPMTCIGCDTTETLAMEPAKLFRYLNKFMKYACPCCSEGGVISPERPTGIVEGNKFDPSIAATAITDKYDYHLPVNRQVDSFSSLGWTPSRSTLINIIRQSCFVMEPLVSYMASLVRRDDAIGLDETSCRMLMPQEDPLVKPGDAKGKRLADKIAEARRKGEDSILGKMWAFGGLHNALYNIFDFRISRHRDGPQEFLASSQGHVQGDCFSGNKSVVIESGGRLTFSACWAHARRYAVECVDYKDDCETLLNMVHALYDIEARASSYSDEERHGVRQTESVVVLRSIRQWLDTKTEPAVLPKSNFAEVVRYINNSWTALVSYAETGYVPIDNNAIERLMKQVALGRKNWLFVGNVEAGERAAKLMSLVSSAKRHDLDVWFYLKDILERLLAGETDYSTMLPDVWKQSHPDAVRTHRAEERRDKAERKQYDRAKRLLDAKAKRARQA
jgi:transposase